MQKSNMLLRTHSRPNGVNIQIWTTLYREHQNSSLQICSLRIPAEQNWTLKAYVTWCQFIIRIHIMWVLGVHRSIIISFFLGSKCGGVKILNFLNLYNWAGYVTCFRFDLPIQIELLEEKKKSILWGLPTTWETRNISMKQVVGKRARSGNQESWPCSCRVYVPLEGGKLKKGQELWPD